MSWRKHHSAVNIIINNPEKKWNKNFIKSQESVDDEGSISSEEEETGLGYDSERLVRTRRVQNIWEQEDIWKDLQQLPNAEKIINLIETGGNYDELFTLEECKTAGLLITSWIGKDDILDRILNENINLQITDKNGRTALHLAAYTGRVTCVELLLRHGAKPGPWDKFHNATPLHCAASSGNLQCVQLLLQAGADVNAGLAGRSALHYAVQSDAMDCVAELLRAGACPNTPQVFTETPLHVAAALGSADCVKLLLEHGAEVRMQYGHDKITALHLAAEDGNAECTRLLLDAGANINARNYKNQTPLHLAALSQSIDTSQLLLKRGANPNAEDSDGRTPLHGAIVKLSRCCEIVKILLEANADVNKADSFGYTPLHMAALNEMSNCVLLLLNCGGDVTAKTNGGISALSFIIRRTPDVLPKFLTKFDNSIKVNDREIGDVDCELKLDFRILVPSVGHGETELLLTFIDVGQKNILKHPLCETFLYLKWKKIRKFFLFSLFYHTVFVLLFTTYVISVFLQNCPNMRFMRGAPCSVPVYVKPVSYMLFTLTCLLLIKELFQIAHGIHGYVRHWENWLQWMIIICVPLCAVRDFSMSIDEDVENWQHHVAAIGIFLTWLELMMIVGRFPIFGLYVQMFQTVAINFSKFLLAYSCLLIAFGLSFGVLFTNYKSFKNLLLGLLKTVIMMSGELEFEDIFYPESDGGNNTKILYPWTSHLLFLGFVLLVTVILTNLMVGLAVSDIQGLQQSAGLDRLVRQAELVAHLESMLFSKLLRWVPKRMLAVCHRSALLLCSQYHWAFYIRPNDPRENRIPKDLIQSIYQLVAERKERPKSRRVKYNMQKSVSVIQNKVEENAESLPAVYFNNSENRTVDLKTQLTQFLNDVQLSHQQLEQKVEQLKESLHTKKI